MIHWALLALPQVGAAPQAPAGPAAPVAVVQDAAQPAAPEDWRDRELALLRRVAELEAELREAQERALRQQQEWLGYIRLLQGFEVVDLPDPPEFLAEALAPEVDPAAEALARREALRRARSEEMGRRLRALLLADGVRTLDLLEVGLLHDVRGREALGPVVARLLDDRGRLVGMVRAEHLSLEVSRAARVVTLVFEDGYESRGGARTPFPADGGDGAPGVRRMALPSIDPRPWIEACPELVDRDDLDLVVDDGTWDLVVLRLELDRLLRGAAPEGGSAWRLAGLGGVQQRRLRDVQFAELDPTGRVRRRVFADSAEVRLAADGAPEILLRDGSVKNGARVAPFLGGTYRIVLPFADREAWRAAAIPTMAR